MDDNYDVTYDALLEKYLADTAKFNKGDVVYFEYSYTKDNQQKLATSVGIITRRYLVKVERIRNKKPYAFYSVRYDIAYPYGTAKDISHGHICSASEYIFREYMKNVGTGSR